MLQSFYIWLYICLFAPPILCAPLLEPIGSINPSPANSSHIRPLRNSTAPSNGTSNATVSGLTPSLDLNKCGTPPPRSIKISYTLKGSLWSTDIKGHWAPNNYLCITVFDAGGPHGTVLAFWPSIFLKPNNIEDLLVYDKYAGYDGWLRFIGLGDGFDKRMLHMQVSGTWVLWESKEGVEVVFTIDGGSDDSSGSLQPYPHGGSPSSGGDIQEITRRGVINETDATGLEAVDDLTAGNLCGVAPQASIIIRHRVPNSPYNTIIQGYFLPFTGSTTGDGSLCITVDETVNGVQKNLGYFPAGIYRPGRPWRARIPSLSDYQQARLSLEYIFQQGPQSGVVLTVYGTWRSWRAPENGLRLLYRQRDLQDEHEVVEYMSR